MKLRRLHIDDYKMFKDFDISFVDKDDKALPIIILAGVNGSGKTTLLEYLLKIREGIEFETANGEIVSDLYENISEKELQSLDGTYLGTLSGKSADVYETNIIYLPIGSDKIDNIKETILQKYLDKAFEIDKPSKALKELQDFIANIFQDLDLTFNLSAIDYTKKEVLFKDQNGTKFDIDALSTGEKTLLSKVLDLFFQDYKNKVVLIDEPELSLHPSWQNKIVKIYENFTQHNNCQIIIATHSPHIIGSAKNEYLRFLIKNEKGTIEAIDTIQAYGRDIEWVLNEMGVVDVRLPTIAKKIDEIQELINRHEFQRAEEALGLLESLIGKNDKDILALRNDLAFERMDLEEDC